MKQESVFPRKDLRVSHDWLEAKWIHVLQKPVVPQILSSLETNESIIEFPSRKEEGEMEVISTEEGKEESDPSQLKWKSFRKRSHICRSRSRALQMKWNHNSRERKRGHCIMMMTPFVVDTEKCKFMGESAFNSPVVPPPPPTNLVVMSR